MIKDGLRQVCMGFLLFGRVALGLDVYRHGLYSYGCRVARQVTQACVWTCRVDHVQDRAIDTGRDMPIGRLV